MKRILSLMLMLVLSAAAFAVPSVDAVQAEVNRGNYAQAESMMRDVVADKPNSAKAHYIYAEVLAHNGRFDQAASEAQLAKQIDPQIKFTQADKFRAFEQLLQQEQSAARAGGSRSLDGGAPAVVTHQAERSSGVPGWVWGAGFAVIAVLLWRLVTATRQRNAAAASPAGWSTAVGPSVPMGGPSYGSPGYGPAPGAGSGMLGTGIAAAGGFAAGMLAEKLLDGGHRSADAGSGALGGGSGLVPGMFDDAPNNPSADELERRSIDFGSGGNDWDSGGGDSFSSDNSSSSDDGW